MRYIILSLFLLIQGQLIAQKKNYTIQEAILGMGSSLAVKNIKQLKWMGSAEKYSQVVSGTDFTGVMSTDPKTKEKDTLFTLSDLNERLVTEKLNKLTSIPGIEWIDDHSFYFKQDSSLVYIQVLEDEKKCSVLNQVKLRGDADNMFFNEDKSKIAYTSNYNLYVNVGQARRQITTDGTANLLYGTSVHRDEFGIDHGIFWSPKANAIAFYRMDQSMVEDYPVVNWSDVPATVKNIKYPFAGRTSHQVNVMVYNMNTYTTVKLNTGDNSEQYLTNITWSPDEKYVFVQVLNREQNHLKLNQYDAETGELVATLIEESNDKYVEPQNELYFINNTQFVYWSQRDGYMHLYMYDIHGELIKQLTKGDWIVNEILGYNKKTKELIYTSTEDSPLEKNIYAVNIKTGLHEKINSINATHTATLSPSRNFLIDQYSSANIPRRIDITHVSSGDTSTLLVASNTLTEYNSANVEWKELKADDGTILYGKLMYPADFSPSKKYPVIVYLYNGPHAQMNKNTFPISGNLWYDYMTQKGYIVFVLDGRGSSNRGFKFESANHRQLGSIEMQDQLIGINYLKTLPYVDGKRMGIHGWSYGGFMTTSFMLKQPDVFKCGVAGGPVLDWSMYEVMYTERYMGTPQNNAEGYKNNLLYDKIKNLKGNLLLIHGTDDATVVWQHSIKMLKQAVTDNIQLDYFVYPGYEHNVRGKDRVHLMQKISDYFDAHLK